LVLENCNFRYLKVLEKSLNFVLSVCYEPWLYKMTIHSLKPKTLLVGCYLSLFVFPLSCMCSLLQYFDTVGWVF